MNSIDNVIKALAPIFAAGFAVQQLLEILTSFFDLDSNKVFQKFKKPILGLIAFGCGYALAYQLNPGVLDILTDPTPNRTLDILVTALVISAGTEGVNSILKFLKYTKEEKKREAAGQDPQSGQPLPPAPTGAGATPATTETALSRINRQ